MFFKIKGQLPWIIIIFMQPTVSPAFVHFTKTDEIRQQIHFSVTHNYIPAWATVGLAAKRTLPNKHCTLSSTRCLVLPWKAKITKTQMDSFGIVMSTQPS